MSEKDELCGAPAAIGMVVLALLFGGVVMAIYPGWAVVAKYLESSTAAAWVQAVGSILAIGIAIYVPNKIEAEKTKRALSIELMERYIYFKKQSLSIPHKISKINEINERVNDLLKIDVEKDWLRRASQVNKFNYEKSDIIDMSVKLLFSDQWIEKSFAVNPSIFGYMVTFNGEVGKFMETLTLKEFSETSGVDKKEMHELKIIWDKILLEHKKIIESIQLFIDSYESSLK